MSGYDLVRLRELVQLDLGDNGYIGVADLALCLLKRPDSLLCQAITRAQRQPDAFRDLLLNLRPQSRLVTGTPPRFTKRVEQLFRTWEQDGKSSETDVTAALLADANALTYVASLCKVPTSVLATKIEESVVEGPIRINTPALNRGNNLTLRARRGELRPCIGRDVEIRKIVTVLHRMTKNMPVLVGEPGVGKTAVVEGLAQYLLSSDAPLAFRNHTIIDFPIGLFASGHKFVGEVEQFTLRLIEELKRNPDVILFLDEIHQLVGAGKSTDSNTDVAQIFKPYLARGEIKVIGATTSDEYAILEKDSAFERRMNPIRVEEPSPAVALEMLRGVKEHFQKHFALNFEDDAIQTAVKASHEYITHRRLPDKAFDLMDYTAASLKIEQPDCRTVTSGRVMRSVAELTGVDLADSDFSSESKLQHLSDKIAADVIGQDAAVATVINKIKVAYGGLRPREKPLGVFFFLGQPGCGKTHLAKALAKHLFGDGRRLLRLDMGEYTEEHSVSRLIGSPPGYAAHEEGGVLTDFIKQNPFSVLLFDEIEKAHYRVADVFLALFGEGHITDGRRRTVDARNTVCIMTSNQGVEEAYGSRHTFLGEADDDEVRRKLRASLQRAFRPELMNRIDEVVVFEKLGHEELERVARLKLAGLAKQASALGIGVEFESSLLTLLAEEAAGLDSGARPLERLIETEVLLPLTERRLRGELPPGSKVHLTALDGKTIIRVED